MAQRESLQFSPSNRTMGTEDLFDNDTFVLWNTEDYPLPSSADDLCSIRPKIEEALYRMGFRGSVNIWAYGDHLKHGEDELKKAGITYHLSERGYKSALVRMSPDFKIPLDMIPWASASYDVNLVVIAKQSPGSEWHRVLQCLKSRNHTVVEPPDVTAHHSLESLVECTRVLGKGNPISNEEDDIPQTLEDVSKIQDFSERITPVKEYNTLVFWDVVDCPFPPLCSHPDEVYRRIEKSLRERGAIGEISIWAYVDEKNGSWSGEYLRNKTWETRIYFLPGGASRPERMLNDMCLWEMDCVVDDPGRGNLIVVSDQAREGTDFSTRLGYLKSRSYVGLITPTQHVNTPDSPEWPGLLLDHFGSQYEHSRPPHTEFAVEEIIQVFWNSDDYPTPQGFNFYHVGSAIGISLADMGFHGMSEIWAYGDHLNLSTQDLREIGVEYHLPASSGGDGSAAFRMPLDMLFCAATRGTSKNLVIAKQSPEGELRRVEQCLKSRNHALLVVVDTAQESRFWHEPSLAALGGGNPLQVLSKSLDSFSYSDASSQFDISKMEDFSERITPVKGDQTVVFWNLEDCPFPHCSDPDEIHRRIVKALGDRGFRGEVSIWAYVDENNESWGGEYLRKKTWETRIYFLPGGASRLHRMLNDILLWEMDSPRDHPHATDVIVVSDQVGDDTLSLRVLGYLESRCYRVFLATPTRDVNIPESPEWPGLLLDVAYLFGSESESSEPNPKRQKEDAAEERPSLRSRACARFADEMVALQRIYINAPNKATRRFLRQEIDLRYAVPLGFYRAALNFGVSGGIIFPWGSGYKSRASSVPERFFVGGNVSPVCSLGGPSASWGFKTRGLGPNEPRREEAEDESGDTYERDFVGGDVAVTAFADLSFDFPLRWFRDR
ncbi:unnamed protein product [Thlaspi arvense]|uniref:NYN domain-containing protein n=1 Tax=Thlaspi arvense TaxID=13288 RepID=A0AAU9SZM1_THLAR|nr:unnamed protein product [Thlaspi arvense]